MVGLVAVVGTVYVGSIIILSFSAIAWRVSDRFRHSMVGDQAL